ncbi:hypothetical protein ABKN59_011186 [Abortiporus biennis]
MISSSNFMAISPVSQHMAIPLDTEVQKEILEVLGKMHDAGLTQSTFEFDLYRLPNGRIVVIDIEDLHEEVCHVSHSSLTLQSGFQPDFKENPCNELHRVAKLLIFWKSRVLYYHNKPFDASYAINTDDACKIILNYLRANFKDIYNHKHKDLYKTMQYYGRQEVQKRGIELLDSPFPYRTQKHI